MLKIDEQQTINYLKASNYELDLLVNFGERSLKYKRFVNTKH
ncbi:GxxExxY protein [Labilibaculum antarcticum]